MKPTRKSGRSWKLFRIYFRHFRIGVWLAVLTLLGAVLYVNEIGLPDFAKKPLLEKLRARGLDLQFTRLRLRFPAGLVAENVLFGQAGDSSGPTFSVKEVQVRLGYLALLKSEIQVNSLLLRQGRLNWPVNETNQPARSLTVENIQTELRFLANDCWELDQFKARFAGANIQLAGTVTNASAIRDWKIFKRRPPAAAVSADEGLQKNLRRLADALEQIHFSAAPELKLEIFGDARDLPGFGARVTAQATDAKTPWGDFVGVDFLTRVHPPEGSDPSRTEIILRAASALTPWATATRLELALHVSSEAATNFNAELDLTAARFETEWGDGAAAHFTAQWRHSATNAVPLSGAGRLELDEAAMPWGTARGVRLAATLTTVTNAAPRLNADLGWWENISPYALEFEAKSASFVAREFAASNLVCAADWRLPELRLKQISADLYDGSLDGRAELDVASRELNFAWTSDCNLQKLPAFASEPWTAQLRLEKPPHLNLAGRLAMPAWTNLHSHSFAEMKPALKLAGEVSAGGISFRDATFSSAGFHFSTTNQEWHIPDLAIVRPEGRLESSVEFDEETGNYSAQIHSTVDANLARLFVPSNQQRSFDLAGFSAPPDLTVTLNGRRKEPQFLQAAGRVSLTNFTFRGQTASGFQSALGFTNNVLTLTEPRLQRGEEHISAARVTVDFDAGKVFITNGLGTANPLAVARAIGPVAGLWFEPYHFLDPPTSRVNGSIAFDIDEGVDLHFDFEGGPFEWWLFKLRRVAGKVNWVNDSLTLKNIRADFYEGRAEGEAEFTFPPGAGAGLRFDMVVNDANFHLLLNDLNPHTNQLAGFLSGHLTVTDGTAPDVATWRGGGQVSLRDGRIMDIPVFGILTPALDNLSPGLGSSRLSEGAANFIMTNGIIHSDDLDIRASGMRLQYRGNVDLEGRVNARAEAELLRDTWVVGKMLSLALWPVSKVFEYKISGTLSEPKMEPLYFLPRLILMPLHPIESMKEMMQKAPEATSTNMPPVVAP